MVNFRKSVRPWSNVLNILLNKAELRVNLHPLHTRTEQMFSDWSNALNNTQHFKKQRKCWVTQHLFSEKFDHDQTSLNKTQQGRTRFNKVVKRSEHFAVNKCSVLFSEMFSMFDWDLRKSGKRTSYFHDNCVQQCKQYNKSCKRQNVFEKPSDVYVSTVKMSVQLKLPFRS